MLIKEMLIKLPEDINDLYFCGKKLPATIVM